MRLSKSLLESAIPSSIIISKTHPSPGLPIAQIDESLFASIEHKDCAVSIDSRTLEGGDVFIALKGARTDGHQFLDAAIEKGASSLIIEKQFMHALKGLNLKDTLVIAVDDTYKALFNLAKVWRMKFDYPVVGITGSLGKTSTKEMLRCIIEGTSVPAYLSYKNQNTNIGLSLNILRMTDKHTIAVFELGINEPGEMDELVDILRPTMALITCIAHAHAGFLGSLSDIAAEKKKIFKYLHGDNIAFIPGDQGVLADCCYNHPVVRFGSKMKNQIQARKVSVLSSSTRTTPVVQFVLKLYNHKRLITLKTGNVASVNNAIAASSLAHFLDIPFRDIVAGLERFKSFEGRFESILLPKAGGTMINDCYNAAPESMKAAILAFQKIVASGSKIAVLGDMLELGDKEEYWHRQIGRVLCKSLSVTHLILVGKRASLIAQTAPLTMKITCVDTWQDATKKLAPLLQDEALVLVKGSLGVGLGNLVRHFS